MGTIEQTIKDEERSGAQPCGALAFLAEGTRLLLLRLSWEEETVFQEGPSEQYVFQCV